MPHILSVLNNDAFGTLGSGITNIQLTIPLTAGHGARFPVPASGEWFYVTLADTSNNLEIVKVTGNAADTLTIPAGGRAQDGTTARAYSAGDIVEIRPTNALLKDLIRYGQYKGTAVASAGTLNPGATGNVFHVTGTTTITGITAASPTPLILIFDAALTLTHGAGTIILPGAANIVTAAGDCALFVEDGAGVWRCLFYLPAAISPLATKVIDRQTVITGAVDSSGKPAFLSAGAALNVNIAAATTPLLLSYASGFNSNGSVDNLARLTADMTNQGTFGAYNRSYVYLDYVSPSSVNVGKTLVPPQYGFTFDRTLNALLHTWGTDGATTTVDDYGNQVTLAGGAALSALKTKFTGPTSLKLTSSGDYAEIPDITSLGGDSWTLEGWFNWDTLPTASNRATLFLCRTGSDDAAVILGLVNTAGTMRLEAFVSSLGAGAYDIINGTTGSNTTWAINTWYHIAITFDAVSGKYTVYKDGVSDINVSSTARISDFSNGVRVGKNLNSISTRNFFGHVSEIRVSTCCRYPNATAFTPDTVFFDQLETNFFSIPEMKMYYVSAPSATAGVNPTLANVKRLFVGDVIAGAATISTANNYAFCGRAEVEKDITASTVNEVDHKLGMRPRNLRTSLVAKAKVGGYAVGDVADVTPNYHDGTTSYRWGVFSDRRVCGLTAGASFIYATRNAAGLGTGAWSQWKARFNVERGW